MRKSRIYVYVALHHDFKKHVYFQNLKMLLFFLPLSFSVHKLYNIKSKIDYILLDNFGFDTNGSFQIKVKTDVPSTISLFLVNKVEFGSFIILRDDSLKSLCNQHIADYNFTSNLTDIKWSVKILEFGVYRPIIINCQKKKVSTNYVIDVNYRNVDSFLDYRDEGMASNYITMSLMYSSLTIAWIYNIYLFPSFSININFLLGLLPPIKAISNVFNAISYESCRINDYVSNDINRITNAIIFIYSFLTLFFIGIAANGYGVLQTRFHFTQENIGYLIISPFLSLLRLMLPLSFDTNEIIFKSLYGGLVFSIYLVLLKTSISSLMKIHDLATDIVVSQKIHFVIGFGIMSYIFLFCWALFKIVSFCCELDNNIEMFISEQIEFAFFTFTAFFYFFKERYSGEVSSSPGIEIEDADLYMLNEPTNHDFIFVSNKS
ncbi:hypothetical protein TRFO_05998 [Tritrichomonas foetus]|uniref:Intimal thickness related receptor IRP domain-containing protein n=1 Tax=Tritrichomonas foetus TaxID=1144522 RepID=A0A1J4K6P3_9EUKA|nr:hypothetical protein TRFO_05998 [Tritrichomonas foetus]|eukprot:OHT05396.1 hypothetical protein TRFO_05998 [Tritrichomonas foetus]